MLQEILIRNFALIDELNLKFPAGLNLLTGETGAGKSIIIDALGFVLGGRFSGNDIIRSGAEKCFVEAVFDLTDAPWETKQILNDLELVDDDSPDVLIVSREVSRASKNQCRVNGKLVPVSTLRDSTAGLVDIHGQHEHQSLLTSDKHLDLLDNWLGDSATIQRDQVATLFRNATGIKNELSDLRESAKERARNLDLYRFQHDEIQAANLKPGEEADLDAERHRLANAERLRLLADEAYSSLNNLALDGLNTAIVATQRCAVIDPTLDPTVELLNDSLSSADDARRAIRAYRDQIEADPERLEEIDGRIELIRTLKRKYGESISEIRVYEQSLAEKLDLLENSEDLESQLTTKLDASMKELADAASELSRQRKSGAQEFGNNILNELRDLGMAQAQFEVVIREQDVTAKGIDQVEFVISPNPGEPLKPLAKVASGGELSRIMLALKSVLARTAYVPTLIFDEIDVGVGGRTAATIADKLEALATNTQVFCITHLPQIASRSASAHFAIEKRVQDGRTIVAIKALDNEGRVEEIARMLGGSKSSATVMQHAREMIGTEELTLH